MKLFDVNSSRIFQNNFVRLVFISLTLSLLSLLSGHARAGGDFSQFKVLAYSEINGVFHFSLEEKQINRQLISGCKNFDVRVNYMRVPWYSWLPFVHTSHPSYEDTIKALKNIKDAYDSNKEVYFGYMGNGLGNTSAACVFDSYGLKIDGTIILSYYSYV